MKKPILVGVILLLCVAIGFALKGPGEATALNVNDVAGDPGAFAGTITVTGITAGFAPQDPSLFGVMDIKELQCTTPNCNKLLIPVRTAGLLPKLGDEVRISGSFVQAAGGYVFSAETIKVLRNHNLGG
ncbi:lipoprotein [Desulfuromonas versatilis]|uniref:Lipoprotein n=1 Tax=Desulfuromonas versatilis TaxID=2802975 RepID=A0ABN6DTU3_9BACT|nr:hypothetical protein [Desulfuromonas versatilis]BCR03558.1 lipoprotein [Desulfuromonas versatilis]